MHVKAASCCTLTVSVLLLLTLSCVFPNDPHEPPAGSTQNGNFIIEEPLAGTIISMDSLVSIDWITTGVDTATTIRLPSTAVTPWSSTSAPQAPATPSTAPG